MAVNYWYGTGDKNGDPQLNIDLNVSSVTCQLITPNLFSLCGDRHSWFLRVHLLSQFAFAFHVPVLTVLIFFRYCVPLRKSSTIIIAILLMLIW